MVIVSIINTFWRIFKHFCLAFARLIGAVTAAGADFRFSAREGIKVKVGNPGLLLFNSIDMDAETICTIEQAPTRHCRARGDSRHGTKERWILAWIRTGIIFLPTAARWWRVSATACLLCRSG